MTKLSTTLIVASFTMTMAATASLAADKDHGWSRWKAGEVEQSNTPSTFGPSCKTEFTSRGTADVGYGITQYWAKKHARRAWEEASMKLHGADAGKWSKAKGTSVSCEQKDKMWLCKATGTPCT